MKTYLNSPLVSKSKWRYERPHRVRLFMHLVPVQDTIEKHPDDVYWHMANKFKTTEQYKWVEANEIKLEWQYDDLFASWQRVCMFYANLTEEQYVDYALRFFDHHNEAWK